MKAAYTNGSQMRRGVMFWEFNHENFFSLKITVLRAASFIFPSNKTENDRQILNRTNFSINMT